MDVELNVYEPATFKSLQNATDGSWDISVTSPEVPYATTIGAWFSDGYVDDSMHAGVLPAEGRLAGSVRTGVQSDAVH